MKITKRQLRRIIETAAGRKAARASMNKNIRSSQGHDVDFEDELQDMYSDIDDYFDGGYDEEDREWIVYDEVEGKFVSSGVRERGPIGKMKAYHAVNSREAMNFKGQQIAAGMMENKMKITKKQLKQIIREEKSRILIEQNDNASYEFENIMVQIGELVEEAFQLAGEPEAARKYWYNGILGQVNPEQHGMMNRSLSMADTLEELRESDGEDMMELGYMDGLNGIEPNHPDNEFYMTNWEDGKRHTAIRN